MRNLVHCHFIDGELNGIYIDIFSRTRGMKRIYYRDILTYSIVYNYNNLDITYKNLELYQHPQKLPGFKSALLTTCKGSRIKEFRMNEHGRWDLQNYTIWNPNLKNKIQKYFTYLPSGDLESISTTDEFFDGQCVEHESFINLEIKHYKNGNTKIVKYDRGREIIELEFDENFKLL